MSSFDNYLETSGQCSRLASIWWTINWIFFRLVFLFLSSWSEEKLGICWEEMTWNRDTVILNFDSYPGVCQRGREKVRLWQTDRYLGGQEARITILQMGKLRQGLSNGRAQGGNQSSASHHEVIVCLLLTLFFAPPFLSCPVFQEWLLLISETGTGS